MPDYEVIHEKSPVFFGRYDRKADLRQQTHYCPGCGHGVVHKLIAEAIEDLGLQDRAIFVSPVGCSVFAYYYFNLGNVQAAHGRTPAVATALKRSCPDSVVIAYQGDGDLAAIGTAEIIHAANRGEKISAFFVNNAIYGMTGGQMAPTTLVGQTSTTTPFGRRPENEGYPIRMSELLATLEAPVYIERVALCDNKNIMQARRAVRKAIELQIAGAGFSMVEILSPCPTIWKMDPVDAQRHVHEKMIPVFPLGVFRDRKNVSATPAVDVPQFTLPEVLEMGAHSVADEPPLKKRGGPAMTIKVAGFGGQGVLLLGQILAEVGMREGMEVSWLPSYGPEMRSGSANCTVCLSGERIGSPLAEHPGALIAMNEISLRKFVHQVAPDGLILYNCDSMPKNLDVHQLRLCCIPASRIADELGASKAANMVMLGALLELTGALSEESALRVLEATVKNAALLEIDCRALQHGRAFARNAPVAPAVLCA